MRPTTRASQRILHDALCGRAMDANSGADLSASVLDSAGEKVAAANWRRERVEARERRKRHSSDHENEIGRRSGRDKDALPLLPAARLSRARTRVVSESAPCVSVADVTRCAASMSISTVEVSLPPINPKGRASHQQAAAGQSLDARLAAMPP